MPNRGGKIGRTWTKVVARPEISARVRAIVDRHGLMQVARATSVRRDALSSAAQGQPLTPRVWRRIEAALDLPLLLTERTSIETRGSKAPICTKCGVRRVHSIGETVCRECRKSVGVRRARCRYCGTRFPDRDAIGANFCCLFATEPGWCGWCGESLDTTNEPDRCFCKKSCSISYQADRSGGLLAESMVRTDEGSGVR